jgi:phosphatidylserine/phosphatidylglycerophosphate/cardiolipin synthase-like enzyme
MITLPDGRQLYHTPAPDLPADALKGLIDFWNSATKSLFIVDYSFNLPEFETILPTLKAKGINVQLTLDRSQSAGKTEVPIITKLKAAGVDMVIGTSSLHAIIHDKFSVVDGIHAQYGSFNYTVAAGKEDNFFFIEPNSEVASDLLGIGEGIRQWILAHEPQ